MCEKYFAIVPEYKSRDGWKTLKIQKSESYWLKTPAGRKYLLVENFDGSGAQAYTEHAIFDSEFDASIAMMKILRSNLEHAKRSYELHLVDMEEIAAKEGKSIETIRNSKLTD